MARPKTEYQTFMWHGRKMKRRKPSKAATAERVRKMIATKAANRAALEGRAAGRHNGGGVDAVYLDGWRPTGGTLPGEPKLNGQARPLVDRVNDALVYLERTRQWLASQYPTTASYQDHLKKDLGHFNALWAEAILRNG